LGHFEHIAEQRIREAIARGDFEGLSGSGRRLPSEDVLAHVPPELRLAYRVLKNAGFVPEEVTLRKEIAQVEDLLGATAEGAEQERAIRRLNLLRAQLAARGGRELRLDLEGGYYGKALRRFSGPR
jgi:hypothetical protein